MAIFPKSRRSRSTEQPPAAPLAASPARPRPPTQAEQLRDRLREIAATTAPEDALDPALQAVLAACGAQAGAVCLYDQRHGILRLAAEVGLSDEGCLKLRNVRRGDPATWDMPLHGLLNRRAYLIESAPKNRYVPRLVDAVGSVRTVACVPLYAGPTPVGSLVLVSLAPRALGERDIRMLDRPGAELAQIIEAVRQRAGQAEEPLAPALPLPAAASATDFAAVTAERDRLRGELAARLAERARLSAELAARSGESERLRAALEATGEERARLAAELERARREGERVELLTAALAAAEQERARLAAGLEAAATERVGQTRVELGLERARAEATRAAEATAAELAAERAARAARQAAAEVQLAELAEEAERLHARLAEAERVAERERELVHGREREYEQLLGELRAALAREQQSREEVGAGAGDGREEIDRALEAARGAEGAALADAEAARATLASQQAIVEALEEEARQAHLEIERLTIDEETERSLRERIEVELTEGRTREESAQGRLTDAVREAEALRTERDRLAVAGREQQAETVRLVARLESFTAERDRLSEGLAALAAERDRTVAEGGDAVAARARLEEALARETNERARLAEALTAAQAALGEFETVQVEATARAAEIERLTAERDLALAERDAALAQIPAAKPTAPVPAPAHEPVRVVTVTPARAPRTRVRSVEPGRRLVAVLDEDASWESATVEGHEIEVFTPCEDVVARLGAAAPARLMVNLLVPGALGIVTALRSAGTGARVWGCIADAAADRALPLGMIEPATRPLDPDTVLALLSAYATRGTRLVTAGTDVDALMSLRQALARRGISVSMAWDAKQAVELFGVVRPEVVLVDLALPRRDGYGIIAKLGAIDPIPSAIILPGTDDGTNFAAVLADPVRARHVVPVERLLADVVQRSEATPVDRRQKVRAIGRK